MNNLFTVLVTRRIAATVSALLVIAIGCAAGIWQLSRADGKLVLAANLQARQQMPILSANAGSWSLAEAAQRRMIARGQFIPEAAIWLDNRPRPIPPLGSNTSQSGFYLLMPLRLEGRDEILWINRGWAPRNNESRESLPPVKTPANIVSVEGIVFAHPGRVYALGDNTLPIDTGRPRIEQNFDLAGEGRMRGWTQSPYILREVDVGNDDGLLREWAPPATGVERHYAYAFQWFALAVAGCLFWLFTGLRKYRQQSVNGDQA